MRINKVSMMVVVILMVLSTQIMSSSAQAADGPSLLSCESGLNTSCDNTTYTTRAEFVVGCCAALKEVAGFERECFCSLVSDTKADGTTSDADINQLFVICDIPGTVDSLCPGTGSTPSIADSPLYQEADYTPYVSDSTPSQESGSKLGMIIGISVGAVVVVIVIISTIFVFCCRKTPQPIASNGLTSEPNAVNYGKMEPNGANYSEDVMQSQIANAAVPPKGASPVVPIGNNKEGLVTPESLQYEFEVLEVATNKFSKENKIGRGGFGIVYKGVLPNGQQIAVKRLSNGSGQGDKEFQTEIVLLAKLQHRNLVRLLGFCLTDDEAILVYEFVANKSLDYFLFDNNKRAELNWSCRFEIIKGVARGMMYIHEDSPVRMMHRDLKAANVLLDAEMYPKIADFGLARICDVGQTHINATRVVGTHGYMAPEYLFHGQFSAKSDVYALGVLILEIVSGRKVGGSSFNQPGGEGLLSYAWRCWEDEKPLEVMDPLLKDSFSNTEVIKCVQLGLLCVQEDSNLRPTMSTVVHMLSSYSGVAAIAMPQHPAYIYSGGFQQSTTVSTTSTTARLIP